MNIYRVLPNGDKWNVMKKTFNGWQIVSWFYEESSALEDMWQRKEDEK